MKLTAHVSYTPAHWSRVCACQIPASATAEVTLEDQPGRLSRVYADILENDCDAPTPAAMKRAAVAEVVRQLKHRGLSGTLQIVAA